MPQLIKKHLFVGKTIERIDADSVNVTRFYFTDGSVVEIEVEAMGHGVYGIVSRQISTFKDGTRLGSINIGIKGE